MRFIFSSKLIFSESQTQPTSAQCQKLWFITFQRLGNSPSMDFNSSSPAIKSGELKLNLFNELVEVVRKMWTILSARIPKWLILAETNLWEYFEDVRIGDGGAAGGRGWVLSTWKRCWGQRRQVTVGKKEYRWQWIATKKYFCLVLLALKLLIWRIVPVDTIDSDEKDSKLAH